MSRTRPLRTVSVGTLFVTNNLHLDTQPSLPNNAVVRANAVSKSRGGSATSISVVLAQFSNFLPKCPVDAALVASLSDSDEGRLVIDDLHRQGVITTYSKLWQGYTVPSAWVMHARDSASPLVVNHNSLPDLSHEEFVSTLGPILAPENYGYFAPSPSPSSPTPSGHQSSSPPLTATTERRPLSPNPYSPAPFDWLHFEGRSVKTTLNNIKGIHSLATERHWRSHCVFSVDLGRRTRQGVEALIPHADVIFVNKHYAEAMSPSYSSSPRAFLLSLASSAPPHALLVADWGKEGAAVLSIPTRDYFQSSAWVDPAIQRRSRVESDSGHGPSETLSVRSGSEFWANGRHTPSSLAGTSPTTSPRSSRYESSSEDSYTSQTTEMPVQDAEPVDPVGSHDAFIAGMIYSLTRVILPGSPYTPFSTTEKGGKPVDLEKLGGKWRLEECLRFATELSGRKARKVGWQGLAEEMGAAGWY